LVFRPSSIGHWHIENWKRGHIPSERKIQARRKVYKLGKRLICLGETMFPTLFHAFAREILAVSPAFLDPPGRPSQEGMVNTAHHIPDKPMARRSEAVDPPPNVTGTINSARTVTPEKKPIPTPVDEMRDIVRDNKVDWV